MKAKRREFRKTAAAVTKETQARPELWLYVIGVLAGLFAAYQAYAPALHGPFLFDDTYLPMNAQGAVPQPLSGWVSGVRPLLMFTYWMNYQVSGLDTTSYHEWSVFIHSLNSILVFFITRKMLQLASLPANLALFAAGLFLLHPLQTEAVAYIAGRSDSLSALFFFGAFALFLYRKRQAISWPVAVGVFLLFGAAMASKENTVVLPGLLLLTDYFWNPGFSFEGMRRNWRLYAPMAIGGAIGAVHVFRVLGRADSAGFNMKDLSWYEYLFTQFRVFFDYLRLFLLPSGQSIDYDFPISRSILDHGAIAGLIVMLALVAAAVYYRRRYPLACYGFLAFVLLLAPTSSIIPIRDPIAERRVYLPMIGLLLVALEGVSRIRIARTALAAGLASVLLIAAALTYRRNIVWAGAIPLWEDTVKKAPNKARPHFQLGYAYFAANLCQEAEDQYQTVAKLEKPDYRLLIDWALADNCLNRSTEAIEKLLQAAALEKTALVYSQLAMMYAKTSRVDQAFQALATAESLDPNFEVTYVYRGQLFASMNNFAAAQHQFRRALQLNPRNQQALDSLTQMQMHQRIQQ